MLTAALFIVAVLAFAALALTFVVARRALRLFVRVALVALVALALLVGYVWFRWRQTIDSAKDRSPERIEFSVRPSLRPMTRVGVFSFASCLSCFTSSFVHGLPVLRVDLVTTFELSLLPSVRYCCLR